MIRYFDKVILTIALALLLFALVGFSNRKSDLYEDMVNASVHILRCGSGVFIDDNVILTAGHVLEDENILSLELCDGTLLKSNDFYIDTKEDVGFIFVDADEPHITKISSLSVGLGDTIFLVGRPYAPLYRFSLTKGIVSHLDRDYPKFNWSDLLQVDAEGGPGSSGGPLYNSNGNLVGMYVGHSDGGGQGVSLCENAQSILEAYQRYKDAQD